MPLQLKNTQIPEDVPGGGKARADLEAAGHVPMEMLTGAAVQEKTALSTTVP